MENPNPWAKRFTDQGALWMHDGNEKRPHALLTSGKHSNGFFNGEVIMRDPVQLDLIARTLIDKLRPRARLAGCDDLTVVDGQQRLDAEHRRQDAVFRRDDAIMEQGLCGFNIVYAEQTPGEVANLAHEIVEGRGDINLTERFLD